MPLTDWELWACAQHLLERYGDGASEHAEARMRDLAVARDAAGVAAWGMISARLSELSAQESPDGIVH